LRNKSKFADSIKGCKEAKKRKEKKEKELFENFLKKTKKTVSKKKLNNFEKKYITNYQFFNKNDRNDLNNNKNNTAANFKKNKKLVSFYYSKLLDLNSHMDYEHKVNEILANLNYGNNFFLNSLKLKSRVRSGLSYLHFLCLKLKKDTSESPNIFKRIRESFNISKMCRKKKRK